MRTFFAITLTLFLVIDALGNIPAYLRLLKPFPPKKQKLIALRELLIALVVMIAFNFVGRLLLAMLEITCASVQLAGGIVLFLIALRLIFAHEDEEIKWGTQEPFIVPIATPIIAGPSVLASIMIFAQEVSSIWVLLGAITLAWLVSAILFLFAQPIYNKFKDKGLNACQRLMGLIVALIAVQVILQGTLEAFK